MTYPATITLAVFDHKDVLASGLYALRLWPGAEANPIGPAMENVSVYGPETPTLYVQFEAFTSPIVLPPAEPPLSKGGERGQMPPPDQIKRLKVLIEVYCAIRTPKPTPCCEEERLL